MLIDFPGGRMSYNLDELLREFSARHSHLCPRQVLGVRMGLAGLAALGFEPPITKYTTLIIVETDGCFADGIEVSTGATIGHRSLRVNDFGKIAATFADVNTGQAIRLSPKLDVRERAPAYASDGVRPYFAQLQGYRDMPEGELFRFQPVILQPSLEAIISKPVLRVNCDQCGEEIINEREVVLEGTLLCKSCANQSYYRINAFEPACLMLER
jgi:formylmethanofuran dehydrogenase subunit E